MAFNRRGGEGVNNVGMRRNPPLQNNFQSGGQLTPQNRPPHQGARPQGFQNQSNGNFRPQMQQRIPMQQQRPQGQTPQKPPPVKVEQPVQQQAPPRQQQQPQKPPQQQQQAPPPPPPAQQAPPVEAPAKTEEPMQCDVPLDEQGKRKPYWINKGRISRKERQRRRNVRLSKILQPKNAVMILNELVKSATYTVTDLPQPAEMNQYTATVLVDGVSHLGRGRSKMEAKNVAAEAALKYIVKNRQFSALKKDEDPSEKMEVGEDGTPAMPWQHVASFALFKLLNSWGEDPNQAKGLVQQQDGAGGQLPQNRPAKKMPENAAHMNPLMLLNQMLPHAQFEELGRSGSPPNVVFTFKCTVDEQTFTGTGSNKKGAKKMAAFEVCHKILAIQYPPEVYTPAN